MNMHRYLSLLLLFSLTFFHGVVSAQLKDPSETDRLPDAFPTTGSVFASGEIGENYEMVSSFTSPHSLFYKALAAEQGPARGFEVELSVPQSDRSSTLVISDWRGSGRTLRGKIEQDPFGVAIVTLMDGREILHVQSPLHFEGDVMVVGTPESTGNDGGAFRYEIVIQREADHDGGICGVQDVNWVN